MQTLPNQEEIKNYSLEEFLRLELSDDTTLIDYMKNIIKKFQNNYSGNRVLLLQNLKFLVQILEQDSKENDKIEDIDIEPRKFPFEK